MMKNPHLAFQTQFSRTGKLDLTNRKPYRPAVMKQRARETAVKCADGAYRSPAPVCYHPEVRS